MRFTSILVAGALALVASAQSSGSSAVATTTASANNAQSSEQAAIMKCLSACPASDVTCQSKCIAVPSPNASQVNQTTECVAKCDQGDGSAAATEKFAKCRDGCISQYYFSSGGTPAATGGSGSGNSAASGSATAAATGTASGSGSKATGSSTATGTSSSSSSTSSANAAPALVGSASFGVIGLIGALLL